jgi:hypothetical protein
VHSGVARGGTRLDKVNCQGLRGEGANKGRLQGMKDDHNQSRSQGQLSISPSVDSGLETQVKVEIVGILP